MRRSKAQIELMPIASSPELAPLVQDIHDFCLDFGKPPNIQHVIDWAEGEYGYHIDNETAEKLLTKGKKKAGWKSTSTQYVRR